MGGPPFAALLNINNYKAIGKGGGGGRLDTDSVQSLPVFRQVQRGKCRARSW